MFTPTYSLTSEIVNNLGEIGRFYGQLEALRIPKQLELNLERNNLVQSSYISNSIEGNPLSLAQVTNLLLGDRVPVNRDEKEVMNYFSLLKGLPELVQEPLTLSLVKTLHKQLLTGVEDAIAGQIRNKRVVVGGYKTQKGQSELYVKHEPPYHTEQKIANALEALLEWADKDTDTQPILKTGIFHHEYVYIHPFEDGNGRTCRLLTALLFLKHNYQINKYFVLDDYYDIDRSQYSDMLGSADAGDKTQWLTYFTDGVKYSLQSALGRVKTANITLSIDTRPTTKEQEVLEFMQQHKQVTSAEVAEQFQVSRQQAHKLLASLVAKGFIQKKGETKKSYYVLK